MSNSYGRGYNPIHGFDSGPPPPSFPQAQGYGMPQYMGNFQPHPQQFRPAFGFPAPAPVPMQFGYGGQTYPAQAPRTDGGFPGIHLRNDTGGVGLPPGYDYAFPQEHAKIHVFKTKDAPWQANTTLHSWDTQNHVKLFVPVNTTIKELMQGLGCNNEEAKKNVLHEITEGGNGRWYKGMTITGDNKDKVKLTLADMGWDKKRTGRPGEAPVVWLWVTKD